MTTRRNLEHHIQAGVEEHMRLTGWKYFHAYNAQRSVAGYPDLTAIRGSRVLVAELKTMTGRVSRAQLEWLDAFRAAGVEAYLWRLPADWPEVTRVLEAAASSS